MARTRRSSPTLLTPLAALMLVNLACSDDTSPSQPGDAGVITDAGTIPDAATSPDAGTSPDAATSPDASPEPVIELVAGDLGSFGNLDGHRSVALFGGPSGIARGPDGALFVADSSNYVIRRIAPDGTVSTFAGVMGEPGTDDGPGARAKFLLPVAIVAANDGTLFVSDTDGPTIRKIAPDGTVETWVGKAGEASGRDGDRTTARLRGPEGLALAANGDLFVADRNGQTIRRITPDGTVETYAGADQQADSA